jgi:hypothetical protein
MKDVRRPIKAAALALALLCGSALVFAQAFTIAVIPDTQNYSDYRYQTTSPEPFFMDQSAIFYRQMGYVASNAQSSGGSIAFAIQLGDLVQNYATRPSEWAVAEKAVSILDDRLPFGLVPGNHDYDKGWTDQTDKASRVDGGSTYNSYFGPESHHFKGKSWYGGSFDGGLDSWSTFKAGGADFLFLGLELEPSDESLAWAQKVLDAHKGMPTILVTHEYLCYAYDYYAPGTAFRLEDSYRKGMNRNTPQQIWDKLITKNKQVFMVLCGHNYDGGPNGESARTDADEAGFKVYQLLSDYQGRTEIQKKYGVEDKSNRGGDGWMRLMDFDLAKGEIHVKTYSTEFRRFETDPDSDFTIKFDWDWKTRFGS